MRAKPKIGLDLHGVILDDGRLKSEIAKHLFAKRIAPGDFTSRRVVQERGLLTSEQYQELQQVIYGNNFIGARMPLIKGAAYYLSRLAKLGELKVITSNYGNSLKLGIDLLDRHGLLPLVQVHATSLGQSKSDIVKHLKLDFYLDDDPHKLIDLIGLVPSLYLFTYQHNSSFDCSGFAVRVNSLAMFYKIIRGQIHALPTKESSCRSRTEAKTLDRSANHR